MFNQQLSDYIKKSRESGAEDGAIKQVLLDSGYLVQDIEEAMSDLGIESNVLENTQNLTPFFLRKYFEELLRFSLKLGRTTKIFTIFLIVVAIIIGGYFFVSGAPYKPDDILKAFEKTALIDSAKYNASIYIETQDKDPVLRPLVVKIPQGEVPDELKKAINSYDYSGSIKSGEPNYGNAIVVDLYELKPAMDVKAMDKAKLQLASSILSELGRYYAKNLKDPATLSELNVQGNTDYGFSYPQWVSLEGKYYTYIAAPDQKSFKLTITLDSKLSIDSLKKTIETLKKNPYYGSKFNEGSVVFEGNKVIFNEQSINLAYNLTYLGIASPSLVEQIASLFSEGSYGGYLSYIPGRFKLNLNVSGIMQSKDSKSFYIQLGGKADFQDLVVEADFEFTNVDKESFFKINKFPSIFMDTSKVRGDWIKLPTASKSADSSYSGADYYSSYAGLVQEEITNYRSKSDRNFAQLQKLASIAEQEKIITGVGSPTKENVNSMTAYKYLVTIDENKLSDFYEKAAAELKEYGDNALIQENELTKILFNSNGFKEIIKYLKDVSDYYVWVDAKGYIIKYQYNLKYIPYASSDSQKTSNKQFYISTGVELSDINKTLEVKKPSKYIEWKEAASKLFGVSEEQITSAQTKATDAKRIADVNQLRSAVELYFDDNGSYPTAINITNFKKYFSSSNVPKDPVTGKDYNYAYYPATKPTKFHLWTELESKSSSALSADADRNSDLPGWIGNKINASKPGTESCTASYNNDTARDCIYDIGQNL